MSDLVCPECESPELTGLTHGVFRCRACGELFEDEDEPQEPTAMRYSRVKEDLDA